MSNFLLELHNRISSLERIAANQIRHATVAEVNHAEGWARFNLGEGDEGDLISPRIPYGQMAGALKLHAPPSVGQTMTIISPGGDITQAVAMPFSWSNANAAPASGADPVLTYGEVEIQVIPGGVRIEVGGFTLSVSGAGLAMSGGGIGHDGKNIGASHTHPGVRSGAETTQPPSAGGPTP